MTTVFAQVKTLYDFSVRIGLSGGFSYTGFNTTLPLEVQYRHHRLYTGPKLVIEDSYFPYNNVWGLLAGYSYDVLESEHWSAGPLLEYQCAWYRPYAYGQEGKRPQNRVQELYLGLNLRYYFLPESRMYAGLQIGTGAFFETYHDVVQDERHTNTGRAGMARLGIGYKLFRR